VADRYPSRTSTRASTRCYEQVPHQPDRECDQVVIATRHAIDISADRYDDDDIMLEVEIAAPR